jgi:U3 small nucleolar RNA-associated protein 23
MECLHSVVDPSSKGVNKHRYVCALNDDEIRSSLRVVQVVPLLYIRRSVLIMEPASSNTIKARSRDEKAKFTAEIKSPVVKRKREQDDTDGENNDEGKEGAEQTKPEKKKTKKTHGRKEPNPLSVKKKKKEDKSQNKAETPAETAQAAATETTEANNESQLATVGEVSKGKRRRKHKSKAAAADATAISGEDGDTRREKPAGDE